MLLHKRLIILGLVALFVVVVAYYLLLSNGLRAAQALSITQQRLQHQLTKDTQIISQAKNYQQQRAQWHEKHATLLKALATHTTTPEQMAVLVHGLQKEGLSILRIQPLPPRTNPSLAALNIQPWAIHVQGHYMGFLKWLLEVKQFTGLLAIQRIDLHYEPHSSNPLKIELILENDHY